MSVATSELASIRLYQASGASEMTELVPWVFQNTTPHRLEIVAAIDNHRSQRVAEKAGAQRDAVLRKRLRINGQPSDAILYSILRAD